MMAASTRKPKVRIPVIEENVDVKFFPLTDPKSVPPPIIVWHPMHVSVPNLNETLCAQCGGPARLPHRIGKTLRFYCKLHHPFNKS